MGCAQSKIDNEESVSRCKDRKILMKDAVVARNAFAAGHTGYAVALKNVGAALSDYGHGEAEEGHEVEQQLHQPLDATPPPPPPPPSSIDNLPPPPPPLPNFSPSPIKRAVSMPAIPITNRKHPHGMDHITIAEEGEEEEEEQEEVVEEALHRNSDKLKNKQNVVNGAHEEVTPPRTPEVSPMPNMAWDYFFRVDDNMAGTSLDAEDQNGDDLEPIPENDDVNNDNISDDHKTDNDPVNIGHNFENNIKIDNNSDFNSNATGVAAEEAERKVIEHSTSAPPEFTGTMTVNLMQVLNQIDDHFLKASQSAHEVSNMLEATRMHYHSNFADNRGYINHSARVMRVITWNKSFKGISSGEGGKDDFDSEEYETHATVLDKLLAWEKKLYEEVKQGELMKLEYQRKVAVLNKQKKRGASAEALEKAKTAVSHLHTRYIVDMQSMDSTVSEVNRLRDEQLYPKLVALVNGMAKMWKTMSVHHDFQLKIVTDLKSLDIANIRETTMQHHERTKQLHKIIQDWHTQFESLISNQKQYIRALSNWLKLNLIPIESSLKEKISSPPRPQHPRIQPLLHSWHDSLEKLPDEIAKSAISSFAAVIKTIMVHQEEEMKLKEKCEETRKEYLRKNQSFEDWHQKYSQRRGPHDEMMEGERGEDGSTGKDPVVERQAVVEGLKKRLEEEVEAHKRCCVQVREKSLGNLKIRLPELFRAMSDYTHTCSDAYEKLRAITQSQNSNRGSQ